MANYAASSQEGQSSSNVIPNQEEDYFRYVDDNVACSLTMNTFESSSHLIEVTLIDLQTLRFQPSGLDTFVRRCCPEVEEELQPSMLTLTDLAELAHYCDEALFPKNATKNQEEARSSSLPKWAQGLIHLVEDTDTPDKSGTTGGVTVATLVAMNFLESAIRRGVQQQTGRAPLLKDMVEQLSVVPHSQKMVLRTLLLPNNGLNLRNLLWHGFLSALPRVWLSLVIILTLTIDHNHDITTDDNDANSDQAVQHHNLESILEFQRYEQNESSPLGDMLRHGRQLHMQLKENGVEKRRFMDTCQEVIPHSHQHLLYFAVNHFLDKPALFAAVVSTLLEHTLRILWCRANGFEEGSMDVARVGQYYVTLDGHGQRDRHPLLLSPYVDYPAKNELTSQLGGPTMAYLTDLFASSSGGPNIRATISHGMWDMSLINELVQDMVPVETMTADVTCTDFLHVPLMRVTHALLTALEMISSSALPSRDCGASSGADVLKKYRPTFSYAATTIDDVERALKNLNELALLYAEQDKDYICPGLHTPLSVLESLHRNLFDRLSSSSGEWSVEQVFLEYHTNVALADCGAARTLLCEVAHALESAVVMQQQRGQRHGKTTWNLYSFLLLVTLTYLGDKDNVPIKAVERSRMCLSTYSTFSKRNMDRAIKAARIYAQAKVIRPLLTQKDNER